VLSIFTDKSSAVQIHTQTPRSNLCTFRFIPSRYMFRPITMTFNRHRQNTTQNEKNAMQEVSSLQPTY